MNNYPRKLLINASEALSRTIGKFSTLSENQYRITRHKIDEAITAHLDADGKFVPSNAKRALGDQKFRRNILPEEQGWNESCKAITHTGMSIYKPSSGESLSHSIAGYFPQKHGERAKREVAAHRVNELLGFRLVPPTAMIDGSRETPSTSCNRAAPGASTSRDTRIEPFTNRFHQMKRSFIRRNPLASVQVRTGALNLH